jgi:anti-sigma factor RsiW
MEQGNSDEQEARLDELFRAYRAACDYDGAAEPSANFMPNVWARIESREISTNWFGRVAKTLVTAALTASVILGIIISSMNQSNAFLNATFVEALRADHASTLEPLHLDRISQLEPQ